MLFAVALIVGCESRIAELFPRGLWPPGLFLDGATSADSSGPWFTKITHVTYDRLGVGQPVTFEIGLRARSGAYDVLYEARDGILVDEVEAAPLSTQWQPPAGSLPIEKDTGEDRSFAVTIAGPSAPGLYSLRLTVEPADDAVALSSPPVDIAVVVDHPAVTDADVASWNLETADGAAIESRQALIEAFAPALLLASGERYHPQSVETALDRGRLRVDGSIVDWEFGSARYLIQKHARIDAAVEFQTTPAPDSGDAVYYASLHRTDRGLAIGYWLFYAASNWKEYQSTGNSHHGDWEGLAILFDGNDPAQWSSGPSRIALAQHDQYSPDKVEQLRDQDPDDPDSLAALLAVDPDLLDGGDVADWASDAVRRVGDHPVVYASLGSHATYFSTTPTVYVCDALEMPTGDGIATLPPGMSVSDLPVEPPAWIRCEVVLLPNFSAITAESPFGWMRFAGRWGKQNDGSRGTFGDDERPEVLCFLLPVMSMGNDGPPGPCFQSVLFGEPAGAGLRWLNPHAWADQMSNCE